MKSQPFISRVYRYIKMRNMILISVGKTRYKTRFGYIVKKINSVEEHRLAFMKYGRWLDWWRDWIWDDGFTWSRIWDIF
jgi:hypothetical protein